MHTPFGAALQLPSLGPRAGLPQCFSMQQQLYWECWEGPPQDVLSRQCLLLAALMDSVISRRLLSADRQSRRRWQVKNSLLAKRLRCGPCYGNCSDERPLGQEVRSGTQGAGPLAGLTPLLPPVCTCHNVEFEFAKEHRNWKDSFSFFYKVWAATYWVELPAVT